LRAEARRLARFRDRPGRVDQTRLQGNILCGYGNSFRHALFLFVRVEDPAGGRSWLGELRPKLTNALRWAREGTPWYRIQKGETIKPEFTHNVAINHEGLRTLGAPHELLDSFPEEFREGMGERAELLGDVGQSAPNNWDEGLRPGRAHVLVTINAQTRRALLSCGADLEESLARHEGLSIVHAEEAGLLDHPAEDQFGREHFGFADGLSQPTIADPRAGPHNRKGRGTPASMRRWKDVAPGEFVLGYLDEEGVLPPTPLRPFTRNASFMVVRKIQQHVAAFTNFVLDAARGDERRAEEIAEKMVGRRKDGRPLFETKANDPDWLNDFRYGDDIEGLRCPVGSHIRRSNPRDGLGFQGRLTKRHRIIRRGMPYGPRAKEPSVEDHKDRGLMFVCFQASIERQYEVIQRNWLNDGDAFGLGTDKDFLVANESSPMLIPRRGAAPMVLLPQPSFVTTRGGDYYIAPGLGAIGRIADGF
jgi:Dyp-type peroxidase family